MDGKVTDRAALQYRRVLLQRRLKRAVESRIFREVAGPLRSRGVRCARMSPSNVRAALGTLLLLPGRDERIDWSAVPRTSLQSWTDDGERDEIFRAALDKWVQPGEKVAVVWHTHESGLRILARDLYQHAALILSVGAEIWFCDAEGTSRWLIECARFDREIGVIIEPIAGDGSVADCHMGVGRGLDLKT